MIGAIWAYFVESIYPATTFDPNFDVAIALMAFLGGLGTLSGPILGALILEPAQEYFTIQYGQSGYYLIIYGPLFLVVIIFMPRGIIPTLRERLSKFQGTRNQGQAGGIALVPLAGTGEPAGVERKEGITLRACWNATA